MALFCPAGTHYQVFGESKHNTLVFIHGVGLDLNLWQHQVASLQDKYQIITYDLLGHGLSPHTESGLSLETLAQQLYDLLEYRQLKRVHLVGFSLGGLVARVFATQYHDRLQSLIIMNSVFDRTRHLRDTILKRVREVEKHGPSAATIDLFEDKNIIITLPAEVPDLIKERVNQFWSAMGGHITAMTPQDHDEIFSTVSHLPHILAFSLVNLINDNKKKEVLLNFAASGFRDFSRIAASSPEVWRDISIANKDALLNDLSLYQIELIKITSLINNEDKEGLKNYFTNASSTRQSWVAKKN